jgi:hypothetical protein
MEEEASIHPSTHSSIHPKVEGPYKPYKRPYKPKPSVASVPYLQFFHHSLKQIFARERKPPKEKEGCSEQLEGPISQCEKICLHQRTPPRPPPPKQRPLELDGLGTKHTAVLFIFCPMVSRLLTHRFPPPNGPSHPMCNFPAHHFYPNTILTPEKHHSTRLIPDPTLLTHFITSLFLSPP